MADKNDYTSSYTSSYNPLQSCYPYNYPLPSTPYMPPPPSPNPLYGQQTSNTNSPMNYPSYMGYGLPHICPCCPSLSPYTYPYSQSLNNVNYKMPPPIMHGNPYSLPQNYMGTDKPVITGSPSAPYNADMYAEKKAKKRKFDEYPLPPLEPSKTYDTGFNFYSPQFLDDLLFQRTEYPMTDPVINPMNDSTKRNRVYAHQDEQPGAKKLKRTKAQMNEL